MILTKLFRRDIKLLGSNSATCWQSTQKKQICCRYGQGGQPLPLAQVTQAFDSLKEFLAGWKVRNDGLRLLRHFYVPHYPSVTPYIEDVIGIDSNEFKQFPTFHIQKGEILTVEVYSIPLQGLSMVDFHLAMRINNIDHLKHHLQPITDPLNYKKELAKLKLAKASRQIQQELDQDTKNWKPKKEQQQNTATSNSQPK